MKGVMKFHTAVRILTLVLIAAVCLITLAAPAFAQCSMCRASLGSNGTFIKQFNLGVLVLLVPPVAIFCTIFIVAFRHRKS